MRDHTTGQRFLHTYCSQCGGEFGAGDSGFSHCQDHPPFVPRQYTPENPPRCRRPDETAQQYRVAMGWDAPADDTVQCKACCGKGWNDELHAVAGHYSGGETFRMECEACNGAGKVVPEPEHPLMDYYMEERYSGGW